MINLGVAYSGDYNDIHVKGLCVEEPNHPKPTQMEGSNALKLCCEKFVNSPTKYDACLLDYYPKCCVEPNEFSSFMNMTEYIHNISETCCDDIIVNQTCDVDFTCSDGDCCNTLDGLCYPCPGKIFFVFSFL